MCDCKNKASVLWNNCDKSTYYGRVYVCMYVFQCVYVCIFVCVYVCIRMYVCMYVRTYVCMYLLTSWDVGAQQYFPMLLY